jgi:tetratricopeptide (TPR) repeat protein
MMIRSTAFAVFTSTVVGVVALYTVPQSALRDLLAAWQGTTQTAMLEVDWPICSTMGSVADNEDWAKLDADFADGKKALAAGDWNAAIVALKLAALRDTGNADIQNYIGYAYRRLRELHPAFTHYQHALALNPRHRSAHEHLGEAYLVKGDLSKAEQHLAALEGICLIPCDEYGDLQRAIAIYKNSAIH